MRVVRSYLRRYAGAIIAAALLVLGASVSAKPVLMLVPEKDFYDPEYTIAHRRLEAAGYPIVVVTPSGRDAVGLEGLKVVPDKPLAGLSSKSFSAIFLVGGTGGKSFMGDKEIHRILREFDAEDKPIGAQCITPAVVAEAGLLTGLEATCWPSFSSLLVSKGAKFSGRVVDQQGNIMTAQAGRADYIDRFVTEYLALLKDPKYVIPELRAAAAKKPAASAGNAAAVNASAVKNTDSFAINADRKGFTATVKGVARTGRLFVPPEYDGSKPWALVVGLHNMGGSGTTFEANGFDVVAGELGFIMCYPDGVDNNWNSPEDVEFIGAAIAGLKKEYSIDPGRVYLTGHSAGAIMIYSLVQAMPGAFAAVAPVAGLMPLGISADALKPVSILNVNAADDNVLRVEGVPEWSLRSLDDSVGVMKAVNGAKGAGTAFYAADGVKGTLWKGPSADSATVAYANGKHAWPQGAVAFVSDFFYNHPARGLRVALKALPASARPGTPLTISLTDPREPLVKRVEFFDNGKKIGAAASAPWSFEWVNAPKGVHRITARATLADGTEVRSSRAETLWVAAPGLAEGKRATASSAENEAVGGDAAFDGDPRTRWSSAFSDSEWLSVDLGSARMVSGCTLFWETAYGLSYAIDLSSDGNAWHTAYKTDSGKGGVEYADFPPEKARYVRLRGIKRGTAWGYSLWELVVNGERS